MTTVWSIKGRSGRGGRGGDVGRGGRGGRGGQGGGHRVLKWWRHKNEISEIIGFVGIFWKNNVQEAYLPNMGISGQIVSAQLYSENSIQTILNFFWVIKLLSDETLTLVFEMTSPKKQYKIMQCCIFPIFL